MAYIYKNGHIFSNGGFGIVEEKEVLIPATNWDHYSSARQLTARRQGNVVNISGALKNTAALTVDGYGTNYYTMATLPESLRPPCDESFICQGSGNCIWCCDIYASSGDIVMERYRSTGNTSPPTSVAVGTLFPICVTYIVD